MASAWALSKYAEVPGSAPRRWAAACRSVPGSSWTSAPFVVACPVLASRWPRRRTRRGSWARRRNQLPAPPCACRREGRARPGRRPRGPGGAGGPRPAAGRRRRKGRGRDRRDRRTGAGERPRAGRAAACRSAADRGRGRPPCGRAARPARRSRPPGRTPASRRPRREPRTAVRRPRSTWVNCRSSTSPTVSRRPANTMTRLRGRATPTMVKIVRRRLRPRPTGHHAPAGREAAQRWDEGLEQGPPPVPRAG